MKEYPVPEEVHNLFVDAEVLDRCIEKAVRWSFSVKRAIYYAQRRRNTLLQAWEFVRELYPDLSQKALTYVFEKRVIIEREKESE